MLHALSHKSNEKHEHGWSYSENLCFESPDILSRRWWSKERTKAHVDVVRRSQSPMDEKDRISLWHVMLRVLCYEGSLARQFEERHGCHPYTDVSQYLMSGWTETCPHPSLIVIESIEGHKVSKSMYRCQQCYKNHHPTRWRSCRWCMIVFTVWRSHRCVIRFSACRSCTEWRLTSYPTWGWSVTC